MARSGSAPGVGRRTPAPSSSTIWVARDYPRVTVRIGLYGARADSHHCSCMGGNTTHSRRVHAERGFNIVEMLAALLVMAVGIIGIAALYSDQTHIPTEARLPLRAAELAESMAGKIRGPTEGREGLATTHGGVC